MGGGGSASEGGGSSDFSRAGGASQSSSWSIPAGLSSQLSGAMSEYGGNDDKSKTYLHRVVDQDTTLPGFGNLINTANTVDPMSSAYETATQADYENRMQRALAVSRTGMENVSAPLNRGKEFRESDVITQGVRERGKELRDNRTTDAGILQGANQAIMGESNSAADILQRMKGVNIAGAQGLAELLGTKSGSNSENFTGRGNQSATGYSMGGGVNLCCFIFLEAYNGTLPWWVRECRDEFITPRRRSGYVRMSTWLVPAMKRSKTVRFLTNSLMIKPLTMWGGFHRNVKGYENFGFMKPVVLFWFHLWNLTGKE